MKINITQAKRNKAFYFQVGADVSDIKTKDREIKQFRKLKDGITKVLVINWMIIKVVDENGYTIMGLVDFLLTLSLWFRVF